MTHLNHPAIIASIVASFFFGFIWYSKMFGRAWAKEMGFDFDSPPPDCKKMMMKGMSLTLLGCIFTSYVYAMFFYMWKAAVPQAMGIEPTVLCATGFALVTWLGFYLPFQLGKVSWEMKGWKLVAINGAHDFLKLWIITLILWFWPA